MFLSFFAILLLSNVITALSSYFLARDLDMLVAAPVDWLQLYLAKLLETLIHSSWMVALMALPILSAYGYVYKGGALFVLVALGASIPYFVIPAAVGSAITLILLNAFPPLPAEWLRELLLRHEREVNAAMERVAQEIGLPLSEGWGVDLDARRFVRAAPPPRPTEAAP